MTRMLDILESFLNMFGYKYLRLDGSTKVEDRQRLMEKFNHKKEIFVFILSTRSGGIGVNLTGADTVVFYDTDWNPAMDQQAQDRCHRIGQTREVHIYRLVTEKTVEENILKKSNQKRHMNKLVIGDGNFTTDHMFDRLDPRELLGMRDIAETAGDDNDEDNEMDTEITEGKGAAKKASPSPLPSSAAGE
jgi:E1A-binding protein p400